MGSGRPSRKTAAPERLTVAPAEPKKRGRSKSPKAAKAGKSKSPKAAKSASKSKSPKAEKAGKKAKKDGPKKPLSAYMFFASERSPQLAKANPDVKFGELGKMLGAEWTKKSAADKKKYEDMAAKDKIRYNKEKSK